MSISISDFVSFTVAQPGLALPAYNVNSLALITSDTPNNTFTKYGYGAIGTATESGGIVTSVQISPGGGGSGYLVPPQVFVIGGGGSGAVVTATVSGGAVTGLTLLMVVVVIHQTQH
jgi:hypothetical protein